MRRALRGGVIVVAIALVCAGCDRARDRTAEEVVERFFAKHGREADVAFDHERGSITVDVGKVVAPPKWPRDVPIYPHARQARVVSATSKTWKLSIGSDDPADGVSTYYREKLAALGWKVSPSGSIPGGALRATRGESTLVATFTERPEGSRVRIELVKG